MTDRLPLMLLPGLLLDRRLYHAQIEALADVAAIQVPNLTSDDTIAGMAARVLADAPERFALCGLSMGGYVSLEIMRQAPDRVDRLALLDTQARPESEEARQRRLAMMALAEEGSFAEVPRRLMPLVIHADHLANVQLTQTITDMADAIGKDAFLRQQRAITSRADSRPSLAAVACPTLVLCGRQDALTPAPLHEEMAAAIPNATLVILPHCGHLSPMEQPDAVTAQLRTWLA